MRKVWIGAGSLFVVTRLALAAPAATDPTGAAAAGPADPAAPDATEGRRLLPIDPGFSAPAPFTLLEGQEVARTLPLRDLAAHVVGYTSDGARMLAIDPDGAVLLDERGQVKNRQVCGVGDGTAPVDMSVGRDNGVIGVRYTNGRVCVWDGSGQSLLSTAGRDVSAMVLGDADMLVYGYADGRLEGRNPKSGAKKWTRNPDLGPIVHLRFQARGPLVAASTGSNGVAVVDTRSGRLVRGLRGTPAWSAAFDPVNPRVAVGRGNGRVEIWDTKQWIAKETLRFSAGQVIDLDFSPDGQQLAAAIQSGEGAARVVTLEVWDFPVGELVFRETAPAGAGTTRIRFDAIGFRLVAGNGIGASRMWGAPGARQIPRPLPNDEPPHQRPLGDGVTLPALATVAAERTVAGTVALTPDGARALVFTAPAPPPPSGRALPPAPLGPPVLALVDLATGEQRPLAGSAEAEGPYVFAPGGERVAAVVRGTLHVWDAGTGALVGKVAVKGPRAAALLGDRLAVADADGKVYIGGVDRIRAVPGVLGAASVALDPLHADRVAVGMDDGGVRILDVKQGTPVGQWGIHVGAVGALAFSADGRHLATAGMRAGGGSAAVIVLAALPEDESDPWTAVVDTLPAHLSFAPDGGGVLAVSARDLTVVRPVGTVLALSVPATDAAFVDGGLRWVDTLGAVRRVAIGEKPLPAVPRGARFATSADGRFAVTADGDRISVWNDTSGLLLRDLPAVGQAAIRCVFDSSGDKIAVLYADRAIEVYEVETGEALRNLRGPPAETGEWLRFSADGTVVWTFAGPREVVGWNVATGVAQERVAVPGTGPLRGDEAVAAGRFVRIGDTTTEVWLDTDAASKMRLTDAAGGYRPLAVNAAGTQVLVVQEGGVARLDVDTGRRVGPLLKVEGAEPGAAAAWSPDGAWAAVAYANGLVRVWDLQRNAVAASLGLDARLLGRGAAHPTVALEFDALSELVVARDATGYARTFDWRISMEAPMAGLGAGPVLPSAVVTDLAVSPDGRTLFSAHGDANARAWDLATGAQLNFFWGHAAAVTTLDVAAGGGRLVTGSADGTVRGWEVSTAIEKLAVNAFGDPVAHLDASGDGWRFAALGGLDANGKRTLRTWDGARGRALRRWTLSPAAADLPVAPLDAAPMLDLGAAGDRLGVALASGARWTLDPAVGTVGVGVTVGAGNSVVPVSSTVEAPDPLTTIRSLANGLSPTTAEVRTPDGALLVTAGTDGRLRVWELATLSLRATFLAMSDGSWIVDRPDGTRFASDSLRDGTSPVLYRAPRK